MHIVCEAIAYVAFKGTVAVVRHIDVRVREVSEDSPNSNHGNHRLAIREVQCQCRMCYISIGTRMKGLDTENIPRIVLSFWMKAKPKLYFSSAETQLHV